MAEGNGNTLVDTASPRETRHADHLSEIAIRRADEANISLDGF